MSGLFDANSAAYVLGSLMMDSTKVVDDRYSLTLQDFDHEFYKGIYGAIYNMANEGIASLEPHEIDIYLAQYPERYSSFKQQNGNKFLQNAIKIASVDREKFMFHYSRLKKFTVLRELNMSGFDTTHIYNPNADLLEIDMENDRLNTMHLRDIINNFKDTINNIELKNMSKEGTAPQLAGSSIRANILKWKTAPEIGEEMDGDILNYALRGARLGTMYVLSSPTGHGKTRFMVSNACQFAFPRIDSETKQLIGKEDLRKTLYMGTELEFEEIQRMVVAHVSGVDEGKITYAVTTPEEDELISMAADVIEYYQDNFLIAPVSDVSIGEMKSRMIQYILKENYEYIFYDYLEIGVSLMNEFRDLSMRNDEVLMMMSTALKELAVNYHVFMMTATQTNGEWSKNSVRNQNCVAGAKSILNKADAGFVGIKLDMHKEELENIRPYLEKMGIKDENDFPNVVFDLYKNRGGKLTGVKIWRKFDYGLLTCRDILLTDQYYNLMEPIDNILQYDMKKTDLLEALIELRGAKDE